MKKLICAMYFCLLATLAFAQSDRGTITGMVVDASRAALPRANVTATNVETGSATVTQTTDTGSFTLSELPPGQWNVLVEAKGFKKYTSASTPVQVARITNLSVIALQAGASTESIVVEANPAPMQTEGSDIATTVESEVLTEFPIQWSNGWFENQAVRNPLSIEQIMPGVSGGASFFGFNGQTSGGASIDGAPTSTFKVLLEGQDSTSLYTPAAEFLQQPPVEALREFALQSSNYTAEFGQAQGGIFNFTAKSGANGFHIGLFDRLTTVSLNAANPSFYGNTGVRAPGKEQDFGGTLGGPITIPHLYNGHNKTFFFIAFEGFHSIIPSPNSGTFSTVPNINDLNGIFSPDLGSQVMCGGKACVDALGNAVFAGEIYDPKSLGSNGVTRLQFPANTIPLSRFDPVAVNLQNLFLTEGLGTTNANQALNYVLSEQVPRFEYIPSFKLDHNLSEKIKLSIFDTGQKGTYTVAPDGLPDQFSTGRPDANWANTTRMSVDDALKPTMLLHVGVGYIYTVFRDNSTPSEQDFDQPSQIGLAGALSGVFPNIGGLGNYSASGAPIGGLSPVIGSQFNDKTKTDELTVVASLNRIKGAHSWKYGGNWQNSMEAQDRCDNQWGTYAFSANQTGQPAIQGTTSNGTAGLPYASFLLGLPDSVSVAPCTSVNWHQPSLGLYAQDTWKLSHKLTLDYGLRYDLENPPRENRNRIDTFSAAVLNPSAGNLPGGVLYQGTGAGTCKCSNFLKTYGLGFGPRLGVAYQINPKTVFRAAYGIFFGGSDTQAGGLPGQSAGTGADPVTFTPQGNGQSALPNGLQGGLVYSPNLFTYEKGLPGALPTVSPGTGYSNLNAPTMFDRNLGRPPRIAQYNATVQREIIPGMILEGAWVGSRGAWLLGAQDPINDVTPAILAAHGLSLSNAANLTLLNSPISSAAVKAAGFTLPFASFPPTMTLANALRPFPQYNSSLAATTADGDSWYNSLQVKLTARLKHNITLLGTYTWAKSEVSTGVFDNWLNRGEDKQLDPNSIPQALQINALYQTKHLTDADLLGHTFVGRLILSDWQLGAVLRYQSGALIQAPLSNDNLSTYLAGAPPQYMTRVPGAPLYLVDPNSKVDFTKRLVLNPAAWKECGPTATFGCGAPYYSDFRQRRLPQESVSLGRIFQPFENKGKFLEIRIEAYNPFNRIVYPAISVGNPVAAPTFDPASGLLTGGFGFLNANNVPANTARNLLISARIAF